MLKKLLLSAMILLAGLQAQAKELLNDIDLSQGRWEMVGVALHNYNMLDIQLDLGTFILTDQYIIKQIQEKWDFEEVFEDYCDYHYALKFYQNGELMKTLRVNLHCNYITDGAFSYRYTMQDFLEFQRYFKPMRWSRIRFKNLDLLQVAVQELDKLKDVYWYGDVKQYNFDGEFSIQMPPMVWNANRDSAINALTEQLQMAYGREDFYITEHYWLLSDDFEQMTMRLKVYCNEDFYREYAENNVILGWRNHFSEQSFVQIMVIGLNREEYFKAMGRS